MAVIGEGRPLILRCLGWNIEFSMMKTLVTSGGKKTLSDYDPRTCDKQNSMIFSSVTYRLETSLRCLLMCKLFTSS